MRVSDVRLSFPRLFKAEEYTPGDGRPRRSASFHVVKGSAADKAIEAEIARTVAEAFPDKAKATKWLASVRGQKTQDCYRKHPEEDNLMVLASHRSAKDGPVGVYDNVGDPDDINEKTGKPRPKKILSEEVGRPYAGCYVNATVGIYIQNKGENQGVRCSLEGVQFHRDGDAFSGSKKANPDDFETLEVGADEESFA